MSDYVTLVNGPTLPVVVLQLLWSLENRGFHMRLDGKVLCVDPPDRLTPQDVEAIGRWRYHLAAAVEYQPPSRVQ